MLLVLEAMEFRLELDREATSLTEWALVYRSGFTPARNIRSWARFACISATLDWIWARRMSKGRSASAAGGLGGARGLKNFS